MFAPTNGYSVDTSAWIHLSKTYPADVFGSLWNRIEALVGAEGRVRSPGQVLDELRVGSDALTAWADKHASTLFVEEQADIIRISIEIVRAFPRLVDLLSSIPEADPFVIALAEYYHWTVVTMERPSRPSEKRVHIPDVCKQRNVACVDLIGMFRAESWKV